MIVKNSFAMVRNLRNILEAEVDLYHLNKLCMGLTNEKAIHESLIMPFRYYQAYKEIKGIKSIGASKVLDAISTALDISCQNIPDIGGTVLLALDKSGSMDGPMSDKSGMTRKEVASLLGAMMFKKTSDVIVLAFANEVEVVNMLKSNSVLANMEIIDRVHVGGGTDGWKVPAYINTHNVKVDNIVVFTDMELWDASGYSNTFTGEVKKYRGKVNANASIFLMNIAGYGTLQMPKDDKKTYFLYGFSDKVFDVLGKLKKDRKALINEIKKVQI